MHSWTDQDREDGYIPGKGPVCTDEGYMAAVEGLPKEA